MKKLLTMGITVLVTALLIASCANPFVNEDGETAAVSDLTVSSITHNSAEVSWVEPEEGLYSDVQIVVSTTDAEDLVLQQAKSEDGNGSVALTELAAETDYTVAVSLVASNGAITPESVSEEFTTSAAPEEEVATTFTVSTITITGMAAYNGDEVALTGSANWLDDFQGWDSPYKETVSGGEVTFTLNVELDPEMLGDYQWKAISDDTWTTVAPLHDNLGGFDNADLSGMPSSVENGKIYKISIDNTEGAEDITATESTTVELSTITITGLAAYNGDEVALTGSANWLDDFQGWDSPYKETVSDGEVTFTLDVELDPAIFADYQWKAITDDTWTTVTPLHDDLGGFDNANLSALDGLDLLIGNSYDLSVDNVEGAADFTKN